MGKYVLDWSGSENGQVAGPRECGNEHKGSIKCGEFLDYLRNCQLLRKDSGLSDQLLS